MQAFCFFKLFPIVGKGLTVAPLLQVFLVGKGLTVAPLLQVFHSNSIQVVQPLTSGSVADPVNTSNLSPNWSQVLLSGGSVAVQLGVGGCHILCDCIEY